MSAADKPGYWKSAIGWIPAGWELLTLSDVAEINPTRTRPADESAMVTFLSMADVSEHGFILARQSRSYKEVAKGFTAFAENDVLVAKITPCFENGKGAIATGLMGGIGYGSTEFHVIRAKQGQAIPAFIHLHVSSTLFRQAGEKNMVGSAGQKRVPADFIRQYRIAVPPLPEQQKIAAILTTADEMLDVITRQIAATEKLRQGLMQILFSQRPRTQDAAAWPILPLCEVAEVRTGVAKGKKGLKDAVTLPYLRVANVQDGHIDLRDVKTIDVESSQVQRYALQAGDVLMTEGGDFDKLGRGDVWDGSIAPCLHQNHVFAVRPSPEKLDSHYLAALAASDYGRQYFLSCAKRTTNLASINSSQLKAFPVLLPSLAEQQRIVKIIAAANAKIDVLKARHTNYQRLKRGLMQKLLTGEWRVKIDKDALAA